MMYLPESPLLEMIREGYKKNHGQFEDDLVEEQIYQYFSQNEFWKKDSGYKFVKRYLPALLKKTPVLADIGSSVGQLPLFLQRLGLWESTDYTGFDVNNASLRLAREKYPHGKFEFNDLHQSIPQLEKPGIVYSKGTICSTLDPLAALERTLQVTSTYTVLVHTAVTEKDTGPGGFITALYGRSDSVYPFSIMAQKDFLEKIDACGYRVLVHKKRPQIVPVINFGHYRLHDLVLEPK
jgi:SAM-dependent methyltransferase